MKRFSGGVPRCEPKRTEILATAVRTLLIGLASIAVPLLAGCDCGDLVVGIYKTGSGETFRPWHVGDTASVFAEAGYENSGGDIICDRFGSRAAPDYHADVRPEEFTFRSSRPDIATVTNQGLVTGVSAGETEIRAVVNSAFSPPLKISVAP